MRWNEVRLERSFIGSQSYNENLWLHRARDANRANIALKNFLLKKMFRGKEATSEDAMRQEAEAIDRSRDRSREEHSLEDLVGTLTFIRHDNGSSEFMKAELRGDEKEAREFVLRCMREYPSNGTKISDIKLILSDGTIGSIEEFVAPILEEERLQKLAKQRKSS